MLGSEAYLNGGILDGQKEWKGLFYLSWRLARHEAFLGCEEEGPHGGRMDLGY